LTKILPFDEAHQNPVNPDNPLVYIIVETRIKIDLKSIKKKGNWRIKRMGNDTNNQVITIKPIPPKPPVAITH